MKLGRRPVQQIPAGRNSWVPSSRSTSPEMARHTSGPRIKHCPGLPSGGVIPSDRAEKLVESAFLHLESLKYPGGPGQQSKCVVSLPTIPFFKQASLGKACLPGCVADNQGFRLLGDRWAYLLTLSSKTRTKTVFSPIGNPCLCWRHVVSSILSCCEAPSNAYLSQCYVCTFVRSKFSYILAVPDKP